MIFTFFKNMAFFMDLIWGQKVAVIHIGMPRTLCSGAQLCIGEGSKQLILGRFRQEPNMFLILFSYCLHVIFILFSYYFHIVSILFPYYFHIFLKNMKTTWNKCGKLWKEYGSHGFQNVGNYGKDME